MGADPRLIPWNGLADATPLLEEHLGNMRAERYLHLPAISREYGVEAPKYQSARPGSLPEPPYARLLDGRGRFGENSKGTGRYSRSPAGSEPLLLDSYGILDRAA